MIGDREWGGGSRPPPPDSLLQAGGENLFHQAARRAARRGLGVATAIGPDRMGHAAVRDDAFVIALLVAVVDRGTGEDSVAVVLIRADCRDPDVRRERRSAIARAREIRVGHIA